MYINIVYSNSITFFRVKRRSKAFFWQREYTYRNGVFSHKKKDNIFHIKENTIHIHVQNNDSDSVRFVNQYLKYVFGKITIGVGSFSLEHKSSVLDSIDYVLI